MNVRNAIPDDGEPYFYVNLKKKSIKSNGEPAQPVELVDGNLDPVDPMTLGNGSVGNVRLLQYDFDADDGKKTASMVVGIQLTKHIVYKGKPKEGFESTTTEVITPAEDDVPFETDEY